jgi:hypothetical protein
VRYVEIDITLVNVIICRNISRHPPIFIVHSTNLWGMMRRIVGLMTSCMKGQGIHIEFKESYNKKGMLHSSTPREEENSILVVGSEEEDKEEAWVEVKARLFAIPTPNEVILQGIVRTLVLLVATVIHFTMSLRTVHYCYLNFRKDEVETRQVQLISVEPRIEEPKVIVITRGGDVTGEDRVTPGKTIDGARIRRTS